MIKEESAASGPQDRDKLWTTSLFFDARALSGSFTSKERAPYAKTDTATTYLRDAIHAIAVGLLDPKGRPGDNTMYVQRDFPTAPVIRKESVKLRKAILRGLCAVDPRFDLSMCRIALIESHSAWWYTAGLKDGQLPVAVPAEPAAELGAYTAFVMWIHGPGRCTVPFHRMLEAAYEQRAKARAARLTSIDNRFERFTKGVIMGRNVTPAGMQCTMHACHPSLL